MKMGSTISTKQRRMTKTLPPISTTTNNLATKKPQTNQDRHDTLKKQRDHIYQTLVPPNQQHPNTLRIGTHVTLRNKDNQQGIVTRSENTTTTVSIQMLYSETIKRCDVSNLIVLPAGIQDISPALNVKFDDLIENDAEVLNRCEESLQLSSAVMTRRRKILHFMMSELAEIWKEKAPATSILKTVFEQQTKSMKKNTVGYRGVFKHGKVLGSALLKINQHGGGFNVQSMEMAIAFWQKHTCELTSCDICCEYLLEDSFPSFCDVITTSDLVPFDSLIAMVGARVSVTWSGDQIYLGTINHSVTKDGQMGVKYDDGETKSYAFLRTNKDGIFTAHNNGKSTDIHTFRVISSGNSGSSSKNGSSKSESKSDVSLRDSLLIRKTPQPKTMLPGCKNNIISCTTCLLQYFRVAMTESKPSSWTGISCFCGCNQIILDATIKDLVHQTKNPSLIQEHTELERKLRHRRINSRPSLRFCPNPKCKTIKSNCTTDMGQMKELPKRLKKGCAFLESNSPYAFYICIAKEGASCFLTDRLVSKDGPLRGTILYGERIVGIHAIYNTLSYIRMIETSSSLPDKRGKYVSAMFFRTITKQQYLSPRMVVNEIAVIDTSLSTSCWKCEETICLKCGANHPADSYRKGEDCTKAHEKLIDGMVSAKSDWCRWYVSICFFFGLLYISLLF